jgi:hypothetical protein
MSRAVMMLSVLQFSRINPKSKTCSAVRWCRQFLVAVSV